jgi:3-oxoacyl-(acyl-carrier-protein) synthase
MGVVAPNGVGIPAFTHAIRKGISGLSFVPAMEQLKLGCQVGGIPDFDENTLAPWLPENILRNLRSTGIQYACAAAVEAWQDAGLPVNNEAIDWDAGCIMGTGICDITALRWGIHLADDLLARKLGSTYVQQIMFSGASAYINGILGLGNQVSANSAACSTGTESILMAYDKIKLGHAKRMVAGSCESSSHYIWGAFDAMRVLNRRHNNNPTAASRPMSETAAGFIPGGGAGVLILEERETALARGAKIYAEIRGGAINSGGQRMGGTMTAPNNAGVQRCFEAAINNSQVDPNSVDLVCGHLTATFADKVEVSNWSRALGREGMNFPYINSLKSMIGHCLAATGSIESVAAVLQLYHGFIHPSINCEDLHPEIAATIDPSRIPATEIKQDVKLVMKANFGFGDVNACIVFEKAI